MKYRLLLALSVITFAAHAMEEDKSDTGESTLHQLARANNYDGCFKLLTDTSWIKKPLPEKAIFPVNAPKKIQEMGTSDPQVLFNSQSAKKMSLFMVTMQKYSNHHVARAAWMKTAVNAQADTPQDCAREAGGSEKLLQLLDPRNNNGIANAISTLFFKDTGVVQGVVMENK